MNCFERDHLSEENLVASATTHSGENNRSLAHLLADLAAIEEKNVHLRRGFGSMLAFCTRELGHSQDEARNRIGAARVARRFPILLVMIAEGRHSLSSLRMLAKHLTPETAGDLIESAAGMSKSEIQHLLAQRFPDPWHVQSSSGSCVPERMDGSWNETPIAPGVYESRALYGQDFHDKLQYLRDLLSHQVPSGQMIEVLDKALEIATAVTLKRKVSAISRRPGRPASLESRHIPAEVADAVWKRDEGRCSYVSPDGRRCDSTWQLEFDHREAFANGGTATESNVRLLCRAHNQYMAECTFGAGFMAEKRRATVEQRTAPAVKMTPKPEALDDATLDIISGLRGLGVRAERAREIAIHSGTVPHRSLEERMKIALRALRPRATPSPSVDHMARSA